MSNHPPQIDHDATAPLLKASLTTTWNILRIHRQVTHLSLGGLASLALTACGSSSDAAPTVTLPNSTELNPRDSTSQMCPPGMCGTAPVGGAPAPAPAPAPSATRVFTILGVNTVAVGVNMMGTQVMANGASVRVWSFNGPNNGFNGDRVTPAPVIEAVEGQAVAITLTSMMPHTIHPHGLDVNQANDGVPNTSGFVGMAMMMGNFGRVAGLPSLGNPFTYRFIAPHAGTYMYHCHVDAVLHFEMGMVGALIVRPADGSATTVWTNGPRFDKEYLWQLQTFDSTWHGLTVSGPQTVRYRPNYFMINGRDGAALSTDPTVAVSAPTGATVLLRVIHMAYAPALVSLGGLTFSVIASDGRPLPQPIQATSYLMTTGERYDILLTMPAAGVSTARIDYYNIRGTAVVGSAVTTITAV